MDAPRVMGMIGCLVLADELSYVLEGDRDIDRAIVLDNLEGRVLAKKLAALSIGPKVRVIAEDEIVPLTASGYSVIIRMLPSTLHDQSGALLSRLGDEITKLGHHMGSILMFYGLCRVTKYEMQRFIDRWEVPLTFLTEESGDIADDCFGAVLGGRERYLNIMKEKHGTIFITPGYAEHWARRQADKPVDKAVEQVENYRALFETLGYNRLMMLDTGLGDQEEFERRSHIFASIFGFTIDRVKVDLSMFDRSYALAKDRLKERTFVSGVTARTAPP